MTYYPTLAEDLARAKEILAKGKAEPFMIGEQLQLPDGGTIYSVDLFAAYKLLESFVAEIERLRAANKALFVRDSDRPTNPVMVAAATELTTEILDAVDHATGRLLTRQQRARVLGAILKTLKRKETRR